MNDAVPVNPYQSPEMAGQARPDGTLLPEGQHEYLLSGRGPDGQQATERIEAASADAAVEIFRDRGYTEIVLHTDDVMALYRGQSEVADTITPREYIELRDAGSFWGRVRFHARKMYGQSWGTTAFLLVILGIRCVFGWPWNVWDGLLVGVLLFPAVFAVVVQILSPVRRYDRLITAVAWGQWRDVLNQVEGLRGMRVPAHELALRKAEALAGLGRLDEALRVMEEATADPAVPAWLSQSLLVSVYSTADRMDEAIAAAEKAAELAPDNATVLLDLALGLLEDRRHLERVRHLLEQVQSHALSDVLLPVFQMVRGILALEEGDTQQATLHLTAAADGIGRFRHTTPLIGALEDKLRAYQALAAAATGDPVAAERHFRAALPRLRALRSERLLARCQKTLAQVGVPSTSIDRLADPRLTRPPARLL